MLKMVLVRALDWPGWELPGIHPAPVPSVTFLGPVSAGLAYTVLNMYVFTNEVTSVPVSCRLLAMHNICTCISLWFCCMDTYQSPSSPPCALPCQCALCRVGQGLGGKNQQYLRCYDTPTVLFWPKHEHMIICGKICRVRTYMRGTSRSCYPSGVG